MTNRDFRSKATGDDDGKRGRSSLIIARISPTRAGSRWIAILRSTGEDKRIFLDNSTQKRIFLSQLCNCNWILLFFFVTFSFILFSFSFSLSPLRGQFIQLFLLSFFFFFLIVTFDNILEYLKTSAWFIISSLQNEILRWICRREF